MNALQLDLDCDNQSPEDTGGWRVFCRNTGMTIVSSCDNPEHAWAKAADRLAEVLSEIRRSACDVGESIPWPTIRNPE